MRRKRILTGAVLALVLMGDVPGMNAQTQDKEAERKMRVENELIFVGPQGAPAPFIERVPMGGNVATYVSTEMSFNGKVVKGAPYSAQAVTESVQTLADGNRIVHRNTAEVYRDSEGRTRREQTLRAVGPYATAGEPPQTIFINDPVSGFNYVLDARTQSARKLPQLRVGTRVMVDGKQATELKVNGKEKAKIVEGAKVEGGAKAEGLAKAEAHGFVFQTMREHGAPGATVFHRTSSANTTTEKLENRVIEGVEAEGTRTVTTIPAGELGNEQPIRIVHERWYSPELQTVVMTRHSDPRFGEQTYRLTNINRSEPPASLFQVPAGYNVVEGRTFTAVRGGRKPEKN